METKNQNESTLLNPIHVNEDGKTALQAGWSEFGHLIFAGLFGCVAIALVALASWILGEPVVVFTREPQGVLDGPFYAGSFSNLGGSCLVCSRGDPVICGESQTVGPRSPDSSSIDDVGDGSG